MTTLTTGEHDELLSQAKRQLRARMKGLRASIPAAALASRSARIVELLRELPEVSRARAVACFWPMQHKHEVDLRGLDAELRQKGLDLYYPFMDPKSDGGYVTGFRRVDDASLLQDRGRGFAEPPPDSRVAARGDIDIVLVPALAVSADGYRIGYGIGFYDVTLPDVCPPATSVVVAYDFQLLAEAPHHERDFACDYVVTDRNVTDARRGRAPA
ncbi:MAG: 5-formyltetrahydrofolate cyclo-ligase [Polyangiaceae bacterium]